MYATVSGHLMYLNEHIADVTISSKPSYHVSNLKMNSNTPWMLRDHPDGFGLQLFVEERTTPPTRQGLHEDLLRVGIRKYCVPWLLASTNGSCVDDCYWIRFDDFGEQSWEDLEESRLPEHEEELVAKTRAYIKMLQERCGIPY